MALSNSPQRAERGRNPAGVSNFFQLLPRHLSGPAPSYRPNDRFRSVPNGEVRTAIPRLPYANLNVPHVSKSAWPAFGTAGRSMRYPVDTYNDWDMERDSGQLDRIHPLDILDSMLPKRARQIHVDEFSFTEYSLRWHIGCASLDLGRFSCGLGRSSVGGGEAKSDPRAYVNYLCYPACRSDWSGGVLLHSGAAR